MQPVWHSCVWVDVMSNATFWNVLWWLFNVTHGGKKWGHLIILQLSHQQRERGGKLLGGKHYNAERVRTEHLQESSRLVRGSHASQWSHPIDPLRLINGTSAAEQRATSAVEHRWIVAVEQRVCYLHVFKVDGQVTLPQNNPPAVTLPWCVVPLTFQWKAFMTTL